MPITPLHRRRLLQLVVAATAAPVLGGWTRAKAPAVRVLAMSDIHSAYERMGQLLGALEREVAASTVPHVIAVDGDLFEHGSLVAVRSGGVIDWAFLEALPKLAPTVFNLGNHDNDLITDLHEVVARMRSLGIAVISNLIDARTGRPYAEASVELALGRRRLRVVGAGADSLNTYPKASREHLSIPEPGAWAKAELPRLLEGADLMMVMSHAGVAGDRGVLPFLPDGALIIGGHNHLLFQEPMNRSVYVHTGSWANAYTAVEIFEDGSATAQSRTVDLDGPVSSELAELIRTTLTRHLTEEERRVLGVAPRALTLGETGRAVAAAFVQAAGADAGFIGHTTLGTGLPAGSVTRYAFDAVVRFDGKLMVAEVAADRLPALMARANQDRPMPFSRRTGDFVYGWEGDAQSRSHVRIVTTDWCALNQAEYFGVSDLTFTEVPGATVKAVAAQGLLGG